MFHQFHHFLADLESLRFQGIFPLGYYETVYSTDDCLLLLLLSLLKFDLKQCSKNI